MPDSDKALGQAVEHKPADELDGGDRKWFSPIFLSVFKCEGHHTVSKRFDAAVDNRQYAF